MRILVHLVQDERFRNNLRIPDGMQGMQGIQVMQGMQGMQGNL